MSIFIYILVPLYILHSKRVVWWVKYNTQVDTKMLASDWLLYSSQSEASILVSTWVLYFTHHTTEAVWHYITINGWSLGKSKPKAG